MGVAEVRVDTRLNVSRKGNLDGLARTVNQLGCRELPVKSYIPVLRDYS